MQSIFYYILLFQNFILFIQLNCGNNISDDNNSMLKLYFVSEICEQNGNIDIPDISFLKHLEVFNSSSVSIHKGYSFTVICGYFKVISNSNDIFWDIPQQMQSVNKEYNQGILEANYTKFIYSFIEIIIANPKSDSGIYKCILKNQIIALQITVTDESEEIYDVKFNNKSQIIGKNKLISLKTSWNPWKIAKWYMPNKTLIIPSKQKQIFDINTNFNETELEFLKYEPQKGNYTVTTCQGKLTQNFEVIEKYKPKLVMDDLIYVKIGDNITIKCNSTAFPMVKKYIWKFKPCNINPSTYMFGQCFPQIAINYNNNQIINKNLNQINIKQISTIMFRPELNGIITCLAKNEIGDSVIQRQLTIGDLSVQPFEIFKNYEHNNNNLMKPDILLTCAAIKNLFYDNVTWYKNDNKLFNSSDYSIITNDSEYSFRKTLKFYPYTISNNGKFKCRAFSRHDGKILEKIVNVHKVTDLFWFYMGAAIILILSIISFGLVIWFLKISKKRIILKKLGIQNFEKGCMSNFNSELTTCEQADLLPYEKRFEYPRRRLTIGRRLGFGAFGVVYQAQAINIIPNHKKSIVAVKTLNTDANNEELKVLISELKILQYLGKHLNIVNLLGCITKNIHKRELMLIIEFCNYGNIQSYLQKNRKSFVNQIDSQTDNIFDSFKLKKTIDIFDNLNGLQPLNTNEIMPVITTSDLVSWAYQIAIGMDFLTSRKVLHGDLAARNILLCNDNIVKICDFGLAKAMKENDIYTMKKNSRLPLKWLALESLLDREFSVYSDVWSFGITLWEIFSLGEIPYPNLKGRLEIVKKIKTGYRMEKPRFANQIIYKIMIDCWNSIPKYRPLFQELALRFSEILNSDIIDYYIKMNEPYVAENMQYFNKLDKDLLSKIGICSNVEPETEYENTNFSTNLSIENLGYFLATDNIEIIPLEELTEPKCILTNNKIN